MARNFRTQAFECWSIREAVQLTQFRLDEAGMELKTTTKLGGHAKDGGGGGEARDLYFDKPFLLILKRTRSQRPYFVMWVASSDLMAR